ncbi:MAG: TonB-dependent receptor domain-containing protein [Pyrinomonadaceae bacterium]
MLNSSRLAFYLFALLLLSPLVASAQSTAATLAGSVLDRNSASIQGATVTLQRLPDSAEQRAQTDDTGRFRFDNIAVGSYRLSVIGKGFNLFERRIVVSEEPQAVPMDVILEPETIAESVVITSSHILTTAEVAERIPGSFEIIDNKTIENSRAFSSPEILRKVAGVNVRDEEGFGLRPNIGIRGLNPTRSTKVLLLEDGIPLTYAPYGDNASYYHPPIDRFESIEVVKGSGQILYGPQTIGAVVNYITPTPPAKREGSITLIGGSRSYFNGHAAYGDAIGNTGLLFGFTRKQGEGSRDNVRTGLNDFNFKSVTTFNARHAMNFKFNYYGEDSNVTYSGLRETEFAADPYQNPFRNDFFFGKRFGASLTHAFVLEQDVILTTTAYGSYFRRHWWRQSSNSNERPNDSSNPLCGGMANLNITCGNQGRLRRYIFVGVEPRLHVTKPLFGSRNELDLGFRVHAEDQERIQKNGDRPNSRDGIVVENNERQNQAYSAFIQNRFSFGNFTVTPGLRIEHVKYQRANRLLGVSGKSDVTQLVPGLGLSFSPSQKFTFFAGLHRGFAPPRTEDIINNATGGSIDLDPELSWNYEVGVRTRPHSAVNLEATFFRMDYENQIVPASLAGGIGSIFTNGGQTLHQGFEFSTAIDTSTIIRRRYSLFLRSAYTFLPVAQFRGLRFSSVPGFSTTSVTDNRLPYAPEHLLTTSFGYSHSKGVAAFMEAVYVSSQFAEDLNRITPFNGSGQTGLIPSYTIWNATANYEIEKFRTTVFVTAKNIFDRLYIADRSRGLVPGPPRGVQVGFKFKF